MAPRFTNYCDANAQFKFTPPFFNRCTVDDGGDTGQCLPLNNDTLAYCFQNGIDFTEEACNPDPDARVGSDSQCDFGDFCVQSQARDGGLCLPISVDGGCPDGFDAFDWITGATWFICAPDCTNNPGACTFGMCYGDPNNLAVQFCLP